MKYIKNFETKETISQEERDLKNLANRISYNINKYFGIDKKDDFRKIIVIASFNKSYNGWRNHTDYDISIYISQFLIKNCDQNKIDKFKQYIKDKNVKHSVYEFQFSKEQAEDFLKELKTDFVYLDANKYNL